MKFVVSSQEENHFNESERKYLLTHGKFRITGLDSMETGK